MTIMCLVWKNYLQIGELSHHRMHHSGFVGQPSKWSIGQSGTAWEVLDIGYEGIPIYLELSLLHAFTRWGSILRFTLQGLTTISSLSLWWIAMVSPSMLVGFLGNKLPQPRVKTPWSIFSWLARLYLQACFHRRMPLPTWSTWSTWRWDWGVKRCQVILLLLFSW